MKINQIIREKRKELSFTQEQIAEFLGVSTPAVSKWEKGSTYPDVTLLPALARLLRTDLNTLMSFHDDLTDREIENFVNEVDKTVQEQNYEAAFQKAIGKIHQYPTCDKLIYSVIFYLEGALFLYNISDSGHYKEIFETFYKRLSVSEVPEIRDAAVSMLISYARNNGEFSKAEELINGLSFSGINKEEQLAVLYQKQKRYEDSEKIWERRVMKGVIDIQTALMNMMEIALLENCDDNAEFFANMYEAIIRQFCFPEWMCYNAHFLLAIEKKNKDEILSILKKMLPAMKKQWNPEDCRLYRNIKSSGSNFFSSRQATVLWEELTNKEEYAFIRDCAEFRELMEQMSS